MGYASDAKPPLLTPNGASKVGDGKYIHYRGLYLSCEIKDPKGFRVHHGPEKPSSRTFGSPKKWLAQRSRANIFSTTRSKQKDDGAFSSGSV